MRLTCLCAALLLASLAAAAEPEFTRAPTATKVGEKVRIDFAVSEATDVAVFVETADGKIVRHLVAGVLGGNPPAPLKANSLVQSVAWDGKADYGKPAGAGPFKVRVALAMGAKYDRVVAADPQNFGGGRIRGIRGLAVADGTLYVCHSIGADIPNWGGERIVALDRKGTYQRCVLPWPADLPAEKVAAYGVFELDGRPAPLVHNVPGRRFHAGGTPAKFGMGLTADGVLLLPYGGAWNSPSTGLSAFGTDGGAPWAKQAAPLEIENVARIGLSRPFVTVSSDGKWAYLTGLSDRVPTKPLAAVYRVPLPARSPARPFFGEPTATGGDRTHLGGAPAGMATDGAGHLLVADPASDRIVILNEADGKCVGEMAVAKPDCVAVHARTGAVYVTCRTGKRGAIELLKFRRAKDADPVAKMPLKGEGDTRLPWVLALDAAAEPPLLWLGGDAGTLLRIEDRGDEFVSEKVSSRGFGNQSFVDISVDRYRADKEVYVRGSSSGWYRFSDATGKSEFVPIVVTRKGLCIQPGPDGNLYGPEWPANLYKWDRAGKPLAWDDPVKPSVPAPRHHRSAANATYMPVCMVFMSHTHGIRYDGHQFVFSRLPSQGERSAKALYEYAPSGKRIGGPILWKVSDAAIGPRFDPQGNLYIAEQIRPLDQPYPKEFTDLVGPVKVGAMVPKDQHTPRGAVLTMYGSIVKFSPAGGMIRHFGRKGTSLKTPADPFEGEPKLDPGLKTIDAMYYYGHVWQSMLPVKITGAQWVHMGISHMDLFYCNCENTRFDVDEFGRVWYPDLGRFRVVVLDTNGNPITHFGRYGNADDTRNIAFAWLVGVGVTDRYAYMGDSMNRRLLRAKLTYAAEAVCPIP